MIITFQQHMAQQQMTPETADLPWILSGITLATKMIEARIRRAGLTADALAVAAATHAAAEPQQNIDAYANQAMLHCLGMRNNIIALISEENTRPVTVQRGTDGSSGRYVIVFDPLDGSSNIDVNVSVGTIFSIYLLSEASKGDPGEAILSHGARQLAAGYVLYGTSTMLVYTAGKGVFGFTLDPAVGAYVLSHHNIKMPRSGNYYSCNEAHFDNFPKQYRVYIDHLRSQAEGAAYDSRYMGSLVADFHRTLVKGGVLLYPPTAGHPRGNLRLLYEARPLAFIAEQAGGVAIDGLQPILSIAATELHTLTPLILGSRQEVKTFASLNPATQSLVFAPATA